MLDIALLEGSLSVDFDASRSTSPLLREAERAAQKGDYLVAATVVEPLLKQQAVPLSVIGHYALGVLLEGGLLRLPQVLAHISVLLSARIEELDGEALPEPQQKRIDTTVGGLLRVLQVQCSYHLAQRDDTWRAWLDALDTETVSNGAGACRTLREQLGALIDNPLSAQPLSRIEALLTQDIAGAVASRQAAAVPAQEPAAAEQPPEESVASSSEPPPSGPSAPLPLPSPAVATSPGPPTDDDQPGSAMYQLKRKLQAFQQLIAAGEMLKAAIIAKDIEQIRQSFDPVIYLPRLFAPYLQALCVHGDMLTEVGENGHSLSGQALEHLYHADMAAFLDTHEH